MTDLERRAFREYYEQTKGYILPGYQFWLDHRPDVAKRKLMTVFAADSEESRLRQAPYNLAALHYYVILGYGDGIMYETRHARQRGVTKGEVLDVIAISYIHAHAHGLQVVQKVASQYLAEWPDHKTAGNAYPPGWEFDSNAFDSGLDFTVVELTHQERISLESWYMRNIGEIPGYVSFLLKYRPQLVKAHRSRYEAAIKGGLPKQMMPYILLYFNVIRGFSQGIRENVLLCKTFGVTRDQIVGCMSRAMASYGGPDSISIAAAAAEDILSTWE
jgi:hypothetical protein